MLLNRSYKLFCKPQLVKSYRLLRPQLIQSPLRFYNNPNDPRDPKPAEKREPKYTGFVDKTQELNPDYQRPIHKTKPLKGDGQLEGELYEELYKTNKEDNKTNDASSGSKEEEFSEDNQNKEQSQPPSSPKSYIRVHPLWYAVSLSIVIYQFIRMNDIAIEFEELLEWVREQPFKVIDALVNLHSSHDRHNAYVLIDEPRIDSSLQNTEREMEKRFSNIVDMVSKSNLTKISYCLIFANLCGLLTQVSKC